MVHPIRAIVEGTPKMTFATAADWPGWSRGARTEPEALEALAAYAARYAVVAAVAGLPFDVALASDPAAVKVVGRVEGSSGTAFGVPSHVAPSDLEPIDAAEAGRRADLVAAAWEAFDRVAAAAPAELRKGPRGGGRDTAKIVRHVIEADQAYAREIGERIRLPAEGDLEAVVALREAILAILRRPSDGRLLAGRRWTTRYAAARIAWHALDHAWEIEDRSDPT